MSITKSKETKTIETKIKIKDTIKSIPRIRRWAWTTSIPLFLKMKDFATICLRVSSSTKGYFASVIARRNIVYQPRSKIQSNMRHFLCNSNI